MEIWFSGFSLLPNFVIVNIRAKNRKNMNVELINYTQNAKELLIYTKQTRLTLGAETRSKVENMSYEEKEAELTYMANTIPSSWEFIHYTFEITGVSRAFTHQFVRTRQGSYAQQTMRVLPMENFDYVTGPSVDKMRYSGALYAMTMEEIQDRYRKLLANGVAIEDARGILPTNICTNIIACFNLRTLAEMAKSRTGGRTQGEYQDVMRAMIAAVIVVHPWAEQFLFPDMAKRIRELEEIANELPQDKKIAALKIIDQIKK